MGIRLKFNLIILMIFIAGFLVAGYLVKAVLIENAGTIQRLSYSRDFEREADKSAYEFLCLNHIEGRGLFSLMETMKKEVSGNRVPAFLRRLLIVFA